MIGSIAFLAACFVVSVLFPTLGFFLGGFLTVTALLGLYHESFNKPKYYAQAVNEVFKTSASRTRKSNKPMAVRRLTHDPK